MSNRLREQIRETMGKKSTAELLKIYEYKDTDLWSEEAYEVIPELLKARGQPVPKPGWLDPSPSEPEPKVVASPAGSASPLPAGVVDNLDRLANLHKTGALTEVEFAMLKGKALALATGGVKPAEDDSPGVSSLSQNPGEERELRDLERVRFVRIQPRGSSSAGILVVIGAIMTLGGGLAFFVGRGFLMEHQFQCAAASFFGGGSSDCNSAQAMMTLGLICGIAGIVLLIVGLAKALARD